MTEREEFLVRWHSEHAGAMSAVLSKGRIRDGRGSSYDLLVDELERLRVGSVLDVGCGDGFLLRRIAERLPKAALYGIDLSDPELAIARRTLPRTAELRQGSAHSLWLEDGSVDAVVSHMTLMLLEDLNLALRESARVLRPGGVCLAVLGNVLNPGDATEVFVNSVVDAAKLGARQPFQLGNETTRSNEGIAEHFMTSFGAVPQFCEFNLRLDGPLESVWEALSSSYVMDMLAETARAHVEARFRREVAKLVQPDGQVSCSMGMRLVSVRRPG